MTYLIGYIIIAAGTSFWTLVLMKDENWSGAAAIGCGAVWPVVFVAAILYHITRTP